MDCNYDELVNEMVEVEKIQRCCLCSKEKLEEQHSACEHSNSVYEEE